MYFCLSIQLFINWMKKTNLIFLRIITKAPVRIWQNLYTVFKSVRDFCKKMHQNKFFVELLIKSGVFALNRSPTTKKEDQLNSLRQLQWILLKLIWKMFSFTKLTVGSDIRYALMTLKQFFYNFWKLLFNFKWIQFWW